MSLRIWTYAGRHAAIIAILTLLAGLLLTATSFMLGIHDIRFDGSVSGQMVPGFPDATEYTKQVGYVWAPNWSITGIIFLPLALFNLLLAIRTIERLLHELVDTGMLRHRDFSSPNPEEVIAHWRRQDTSKNLSWWRMT